MTSTLFQQFLNLIKESSQDQDFSDINTYDLLVDVLFEQVEANLNFFSHRFDQVFALFTQLLQNYQTESTTLIVCSNLFEVFVVMVERKPILIKKNQNRLLSLIQKIFQMFNMVDFHIDQAWMKPAEGYNDDIDFDEENNLTKQIISYIDRIANTYQYPKFVEFFLLILPNWWTASENNWKARYCILMMMSQLGQSNQFPLTIKNFIQCGIQSASHANPKVRYGALQMFGQLADDMKPQFQHVYGEQILPVIMGLLKDQVPRVHGHAMACLTNFLEELQNQDFHIMTPYTDEIINFAQSFSHNGISLVKQNTVSALASLCSSGFITSQQVQKILSIINFLLTNQIHQKPQYNQLMNQTMQCLSMVLYGQKDKVQNVFTQSVNVIKSLKSRISASYLVSGWSRICLKYENFTDLSDIFPQILHSAANMIQNYESEVDAAIKSILNSITSFKSNIKPYANGIIELCKNGVAKFQEEAHLKASLYEVLDQLVVTLKNEAPDPEWEQMSKNVFQFLYQQVENILSQEFQEQIPEFQSLEQALKALQRCISHSKNLFTGQNITTFSQNIFNFATKIHELVKKVKKEIEDLNLTLTDVQDEIDRQDIHQSIKIDEENIQKLLSARLVIPDLFQQILKVSQKSTQVTIVQSLYPYVSQFLQNFLPHEEIRYGLYFLCDFLSALDYEGIKEHLNVYESKFTEHCLSPNIQVRNCAVFGLGQLMKKIPAEQTDENLIYKWLNLLWSSLSLSSSQQSEKKKFNFARDNIVSALGKLIFSKRLAYPTALNQQVHKKWFQFLPLNNDKTEGDIQHEILLRLLETTPETFISTKQDIQKLLIIFARYFTKRMNKKDDLILKNRKETKDYLFKMKNWPIFNENLDFLWNNLSSNHRQILTQIMSAP